jgi:hypothetical protein
MVKVPHDEKCMAALDNIRKIEGMSIERGLGKNVSSALGGRNGCTHMVEITMSAARMASNAIIGLMAEGKDWKDLSIEDDDFMDKVRPYLENSCIVFKIDRKPLTI